MRGKKPPLFRNLMLFCCQILLPKQDFVLKVAPRSRIKLEVKTIFLNTGTFNQGHNRSIFQRGQSNFSWFFSRREILFSHFGTPKTNLSSFEKWKEKKKKKRKEGGFLSSFFNFSSFHFPFATFPFLIFLLFFSIFPFFLASPFKSAEISWWEVSWGHSAPCPPSRLLRHLVTPLLLTPNCNSCALSKNNFFVCFCGRS